MPIGRYGYYVAGQGLLCGDPEYAEESRCLYLQELGQQDPEYIHGRYDGASIWATSEGVVIKRIIVQGKVRDSV